MVENQVFAKVVGWLWWGRILWKISKIDQTLPYFTVLNRNLNLEYILTLSWRRSLSYKKQSIDLFCKSDRNLRHERVKLRVNPGLKVSVEDGVISQGKSIYYTGKKINYNITSQDILLQCGVIMAKALRILHHQYMWCVARFGIICTI